MNESKRFSVGRIMSVGALVAGLAIFASSTVAQESGSDAVIDAEVVATIVIEGGDAQGGNATGGDAKVSMNIGGANDSCDCGAEHVVANQQVVGAVGGTAVGGDARGGDGLNAFVDADVVLDADVSVDVSANVGVGVDASAGAGATAPDVSGDVSGLSSLSASQPIGTSNSTQQSTDELSSAIDAVSPLLGGLGGLQLLTLDADLFLEVAGGDAVGGNATAGNAVVEMNIGGGSSNVMASQDVGIIVGGLAVGGAATGGDGIELDIILDADIDLVIDAIVDVTAEVDADVDADANVGN